MTWRVRSLVLLSTLAVAACGEVPVSPAADMRAASTVAGLSETGRYVVLFENTAVPSQFADRVAALGGTVDASYDGAGVAVVSGLDATAAASLSDLGEVGSDELFQILDPGAQVETEAAADALNVGPASGTDPTTAFFYPRQWNMRQIGANTAWAAGKLGSSSVKVAILDTGIDYLYPDLVGRVDLANSASFTNDNSLVALYFPTRHVTTDIHYHGTHVASTVVSNANVIAGVTSQTTLMAVKVLNVNGSGASSWILAGIVYAADHGADVINMSLGNRSLPYDMKNKSNKDSFNKIVDRAFAYAHSKGVTVVVAAGNEAQNLDVKQSFKPYCGALHAICVSATGPTSSSGTNGPWVNPDAVTSYTNYGLNKVDVAAPGGTSFGRVWAACSSSSLVIPICRTGVFILGATGTSMASPHTAGLAALLISERKGGRALGDIRSSIFNGAADLGAQGEDAYYGHGRIDVARALGLQ